MNQSAVLEWLESAPARIAEANAEEADSLSERWELTRFVALEIAQAGRTGQGAFMLVSFLECARLKNHRLSEAATSFLDQIADPLEAYFIKLSDEAIRARDWVSAGDAIGWLNEVRPSKWDTSKSRSASWHYFGKLSDGCGGLKRKAEKLRTVDPSFELWAAIVDQRRERAIFL